MSDAKEECPGQRDRTCGRRGTIPAGHWRGAGGGPHQLHPVSKGHFLGQTPLSSRTPPAAAPTILHLRNCQLFFRTPGVALHPIFP